MGEIIGVVSGKGGVGKTTITACLGAALSHAGHRVLLCDGDFGLRDLDLVLGVADEIIYDALDASEDKDYTDDAIVSIAENLDFLPASQSARWEDIGRKKYKKLVRRLCDVYDYILIDAPAGIGKGIESILDLVSRCIVVTHPLWVSLRNGARMIQVCQEHNIRDYAIAFNAVPMEGEDINLYDMLEVLRAEYVGAMIPYDEDVLTYTQDGHLLELISMDLTSVLAPLVDYVVTGDCWEDYDVQKQFDDYVAKKKASKEQASTPSLATTGESIFDDSSHVHYINRGGWTTQRLLVQGKQSQAPPQVELGGMMWQKIWTDSDWTIIICTLLLVGIGLTAIGSATHVNQEAIGFGSLVVKQLVFFLANVAVVIGMQFIDYHRLKGWGNIIYGITLLMLIAVMAVGTSALGAQRWIQLGPITIQPSEFSKLLMIICMAKMLEPRIGKLNTFKSLILPVLYVGVPIALVFLQPDLGTSLVYIAIFVGMLFISGIKTRLIKIIAGTGLLLMPLGWFVLKEYQKQRILVFLNPDIDPFGSGYHIIQSKIAIGSGLIFGKGIFNGTQSQLNFLPENHTDFIFSVIGEEFGFVGCIVVLLLLFMLIYRSIQVAYTCNDNFGMLLATGIGTMFAFEVLVNVGMTIGIMPVTGIPLPFLSYGVSALTTNMLSIGILLNIAMQRTKYIF